MSGLRQRYESCCRYCLLHPHTRILYLASMKFRLMIAILLLLSACGGRKMNNNLARNLIIGATSDTMHKSDVDVVNIQQTSATEAVVETRMRTAFRFEKDGNIWRIREVQRGHGQWENMENFEQALNQIKMEETEMLLLQIADAIRKYRDARQTFPTFRDFIDLTDQLNPAYMTPLIRLDAWQRPLEATFDSTKILLRSAGPDGLTGTPDDISTEVVTK